MVALAQLVADHLDSFGYITYVFKCLDNLAKETPYIMCTRYPNWDHRTLSIGEKGYLSFEEIRAGVDTWFNGTTMVPYKYDGVHFIKFVDIPSSEDSNYIM